MTVDPERQAALAELTAIYEEVQADAIALATGQAPRQLFERMVDADVACVAESLGPRTQRVTGIPWVLPNAQLSDKGELLDRDLLGRFGYTANPWSSSRTYAYLTDVSHLWLGRQPDGKLRRPSTTDKDHCAPWLARELQAVRPRVVLLLGRHAASFFLARFTGVRIRRLEEFVAQQVPCFVGSLETTAVPTLHPTGAQMARGGSYRSYDRTVAVVAELLAS